MTFTFWAFVFCWCIGVVGVVSETIEGNDTGQMLWLIAMFVCWVGMRGERRA